MPSAPRLSVIVPSRDRPGLLQDCLESVRAQGAPGLEVIVVDDGSSVALDAVAAAAGAWCVRQPPLGLNAARDAGVARARAPLVAFLDDDVTVAAGWAEAMVAAAEHGADAVAGRVELDLRAPSPRWLTPELRGYLSEYAVGSEPGWIAGPPLPVGANCAVRREMFDRVGGFRAGLDRVDDSLLSAGDTEFFWRVRAAGGRLRYAPDALAVHRIGPERLTLSYFRRRARAQGASDGVYGIPWERWPRLWPLKWPARVAAELAGGLLRGHGPVPALLYVDYCRGRIGAR